MTAHLSKAYERLGVEPGVSSRELKSAHRDLAKVWHPDRFLHDPRLQQKAQEKLKEINEAYELLSSGKSFRPTKVSAPRRPPSDRYPAAGSSARRSTSNRRGLAVPLFIFVAVFSITIRALLTQPTPPELLESGAPQVKPQTTSERTTPTDTNARVKPGDTSARANEQSAPTEVTASETTENTATVATVTVAIDPESGLLAKQDCPVRSRMTYPRGSEPTGHCNINHAPPSKDSRLKSFARSVGRSLDQVTP